MGYLRNCNKRRSAEIAACNPQPGQWAQLSDWFDDVWGRIDAVYPPTEGFGGALSMYQDKSGRPQHTFFHEIRCVSAELPRNARIVKDKPDGA